MRPGEGLDSKLRLLKGKKGKTFHLDCDPLKSRENFPLPLFPLFSSPLSHPISSKRAKRGKKGGDLIFLPPPPPSCFAVWGPVYHVRLKMRCNARLKRWNWLETEYKPSFFLWKIPHPSSFRNFKANKLLYLRRSQKAYFLINRMLVILQQTVWVFKYYTVILLMGRPPSFHDERIAGVNPISEMGSVVDRLGMPQCPASWL